MNATNIEAMTRIVLEGCRIGAKKRPRFSRANGRVFSPSAKGEKSLAWLMRSMCPGVCYSVPVAVSIVARGFLPGDADNYAKFVLDALQKARILENDRLVRELHVLIAPADSDSLDVAIRPLGRDEASMFTEGEIHAENHGKKQQ